ncbi:MAG: hypothetical protein P4L27_14470 [Ignavibacteriaceae bacterium]|nr:hypothetical protein [Ignavibacteriaceae bacterium]
MFLILLIFNGCKNPFAPAFDTTDGSANSLISDQKTIDGVFQNFQYAYAIKDTSIYGNLLLSDFNFIYRDYDAGYDVSWGRDEEMKTTYGLFQNAQQLNLIWNNIVLSTEDSLSANIIRGFNLTITFNPTDVIRLDGRVNLLLSRTSTNSKWQITQWIDESQL